MSRFIYLSVAVVASSMSVGFSGCCTSGCHSGGGLIGGFIDNFMQEQVACLQQRVWAKRAFHLRYGHCERLHAAHFRDGFIAGYCNVCEGNGVEPPALPPEKYWGFQYRNQEGAEMQSAWFAGFEDGAQIADSDGSSSYRNIQISQQVERAILEADQLQDLHSGIQREFVVGQNRELGSGLPKSNSNTKPMLNISQTLPEVPVIQGSGSYDGSGSRNFAPATNTPTTNTSVSPPTVVPAFPTAAQSNTPLPISVAPPLPAASGYPSNQ